MNINKCLKKFIESPEWRNINWKLNFWMDNITGEKTKIWDADGLKEKARYVKYCIKKQYDYEEIKMTIADKRKEYRLINILFKTIYKKKSAKWRGGRYGLE